MTSGVEPVIIDLSAWSRGGEVRAYAEDRGVDVAEAIRLLVNAGLSNS